MKVKPEGLRGAANICSRGGRHPLTAMFGADETSFRRRVCCLLSV